MSVIDFIKKEFQNFGKYEKILFPLVIFVILFISIITNDNKIALVSAICGISYTILAGKGKISCYFIGIIGTFCYAYLSFINGFYGNLILYSLYFFPMEIIGIYKWKNNLNEQTQEVIKTELSPKERVIYFSVAIIFSLILSVILNFIGGVNSLFDSTTMIFSILGQILTVKRCVEQWYVWFIVNLLALIMWIYAYINGSNCLATILMWAVYLILSVYFLRIWKREIEKDI